MLPLVIILKCTTSYDIYDRYTSHIGTHRFNQKQIQKPINELRTPMMLFFNCLTQLLILKIVKIVNYHHLLRCTLRVLKRLRML